MKAAARQAFEAAPGAAADRDHRRRDRALPFAAPRFVAENAGAETLRLRHHPGDRRRPDRHRAVPRDPAQCLHLADHQLRSPVQYSDWKAINAQALITGAVEARGDGNLVIVFRLFDVFSEAPLGEGLQFVATEASWRRIAHKVADAVYSRITGEGGYFDSRVVFVAESGRRTPPQAAGDHGLRRRERAVPHRQLHRAGAALLAHRRPGALHQLRDRLPAGLRSRCRQRHAPGAGRSTRHHDLRAALLARRQTVVYSLSRGGNTDIYACRSAAARRSG
jgi:TolB protein